MPFGASHSFNFIGGDLGSRGDYQDIIWKFLIAFQQDLIFIGSNQVYFFLNVLNPFWNEFFSNFFDLLGFVNVERQEQKPRLIIMGFVLIHNRNFPFLFLGVWKPNGWPSWFLLFPLQV